MLCIGLGTGRDHTLGSAIAALLAFQDRYNSNATPFDWTFTRTDLRTLLDRIDRPPTPQTLPTAA
jgi:hypothetical protein